MRGGFEQCRKEACEEGLISIYRSISTTYHSVIPRSSSRDEEDEVREWWALAEGSLGWTSRWSWHVLTYDHECDMNLPPSKIAEQVRIAALSTRGVQRYVDKVGGM